MKDSFLVALLVIIAGIISIEAGISTAIFEILAGVIGANVLGIESVDWLNFLANFGLLGIMFFAGFETNGEMIKKYYKKSLSIGLASYIVPFALIFVLAFLIFNLELRSSFLIGIAMSTTSLALVYPLLKERGILNRKNGQILLTSAMVVDILSMLSLSLIFGGFGRYTIIFIIAILVSLYLLPRLGRWLFSRYESGITQFKVRFILLVLLALGFFSEKAGVHAAILAFVAGFVFSELLEEHEVLEEKLRGLVFGFLAPLFFLKAGLAVNLSLINMNTLFLVCLLTIVAFIGKFFGTFYVTKKYLKKTAKFAGFLFNFRLSFGIIVAIFGLSTGLINESFYIAIITTIILTSLISSAFLKIIPHEI